MTLLLSTAPPQSMKRRRECALAGIPVPWREGLRGGPTRSKRRALYAAICPRCGRVTNAVTAVDTGGREYFMARSKFRVCRCLCGHTWRENDRRGQKGFPHVARGDSLDVPAAPEVQRLPWYRRWWAALTGRFNQKQETV